MFLLIPHCEFVSLATTTTGNSSNFGSLLLVMCFHDCFMLRLSKISPPNLLLFWLCPTQFCRKFAPQKLLVLLQKVDCFVLESVNFCNCQPLQYGIALIAKSPWQNTALRNWMSINCLNCEYEPCRKLKINGKLNINGFSIKLVKN